MNLHAPDAFGPGRPVVRPAWRDEAPRLLATLTLAFAADPACRWLYPDATQFLRHFPSLALAMGGAGIARGTSFVVDGYRGVSLWLGPGVAPDEDALETLLRESVALPEQADAFRLFELRGRRRPSDPHWYLPLIGVEPAHRGRGAGTAMLERALRRADLSGMPTYVEATDPRHVACYRRHGFEAVGRIEIGHCPALTPMLRPAGRQRIY